MGSNDHSIISSFRELSASSEYIQLLENIKIRVSKAHLESLKLVNQELIFAYQDIGELIAHQQKGETWGKSIVEQLSKDLRAEFKGVKGFSARLLWKMRDFYLTYKNNQKLASLTLQISWTHNVIVMEKCQDNLQREFYIRMSIKNRWSSRVLIESIKNGMFRNTVLNQTNFNDHLPKQIKNEALLQIKDEYTFDFLSLKDKHSEHDLEQAIINKIENFLVEMGGLFTFVGSQYKLEVNGESFFIDLVLYHRNLRSLVAVELKRGKFLPEHVGKMQFYLAVLDDTIRLDHENPSIGIILCREKNKTIVEYALRESKKPMGIAGYNIVKKLPKELEGDLPSIEEIAQLIDSM